MRCVTTELGPAMRRNRAARNVTLGSILQNLSCPTYLRTKKLHICVFQTVICPGRVDGNADNVSKLFLFPLSAMKPSKFHGLNRRWVNTHPAHSDVHYHCSIDELGFEWLGGEHST